MVISGVNTVTYNGDGITTAWPYTFPVTDDSEIRVQLNNADGTAVIVESDYYIDLINSTVYYPGYAPGSEPPEAEQPPKVQEGQTITVYREIPITQESDLGEKWPFEVIEKGLDKLTMIAQQIDSGTKRTLDNALASMEMLADVVVDSDELQHITDQFNAIDANAAAAAESEANALSYKNAAAASATNAASSATVAANSANSADTAATQLMTYLADKEEITAPAVDPTLTISGAAADAKVAGDKVSQITGKMKLVKPMNIWDSSSTVSGYIGLNGSINSGSSYCYMPEYIPVSEGDVVRGYYYDTSIVTANARYITAYDSTKTAIPSKGGDNVHEYTVPAGVHYIRITLGVTYSPYSIVTINKIVSSLLPYFDPYYMADDGFFDGIDIDKETTFDVVYLNSDNVNRLNPDECQIGKYMGQNGIINNNSSYFISGYVPINPNETLYIFSNQLGIVLPTMRSYCVYDKDMNIIDSGDNVTSVAYVSGAKSIRFSSIYRSDDTAFQPGGIMVIPNNDPTEFVAYGAKTPKIKQAYIPHIADSIPLVYLPPEICVGVGRTVELYNELVCRNADRYHLHYSCTVGVQYERKFTIVGANSNIGTYTLTLRVYDDDFNKLWEGTSTVKIVANNIANTLNILPIGDSLTNRKPWLNEVQILSNNKVHFIGTRGFVTDPFHQEGRSGFSAANYLANTSYTYDNNYVGNPNFSASANPFWDTDNNKFSLSYWITNQAATVGTPDAVQIFLGTNGMTLDPTTNVNNIVAIVDAIQDEYPDMPIFVCNTIYHSNQNGFYSAGGDGYDVPIGDWAFESDLKTMRLQLALTAALDGYSNVYIAPLSICMDRENDFGQVEVSVNPRLTTVTTTIPIESTHPQVPGYMQIADVLYSSYCAHLS